MRFIYITGIYAYYEKGPGFQHDTSQWSGKVASWICVYVLVTIMLTENTPSEIALVMLY